MGKKTTVGVSMRALYQRLNRRLRDDDQVLKATRGEQANRDLGAYYILDNKRNAIIATHVEPEKLGRKLGVLQPYEHVIEELRRTE